MAKNRKVRQTKKDGKAGAVEKKRIVLAGTEIYFIIYPIVDGKLGKAQSFPDKIVIPSVDFKNLEKILSEAYNNLCSKYNLEDKGIS